MQPKTYLYVCLPAALVLLATLFFRSPVSRTPSPHTFTGLTMGTSWSVLLNTAALPLPRPQLQAQFDSILQRVNGQASTWLPESELSRINAGPASEWLPVSPALREVLQAAGEISRLTQGAFDVSIAPLVELWGFGVAENVTVPEDAQVTRALALVGHEKLQLDPAASRLRKAHDGIAIDLSAIAKGYGVDQLAAYLEQLHVADYLVEIGGELRARGVNARQEPWQVGIEQPRAGTRGIHRVIRLENVAMATSGDYRNFFEQDGRRYSHTIDPRTGRPVTHDLASVTVLHPSAMLADAWATGLLVLGAEKGYATALENGLAAYFIVRTDTGFEEQSSPAFQPHIVTSLPKKLTRGNVQSSNPGARQLVHAKGLNSRASAANQRTVQVSSRRFTRARYLPSKTSSRSSGSGLKKSGGMVMP